MKAKFVFEALDLLTPKSQREIENEMIGKWFFQSNNPYQPFKNLTKVFKLLAFDGDKIKVKEIYPGTKTELNKKHLFSKFGADYHYYPIDFDFLEDLDSEIATLSRYLSTDKGKTFKEFYTPQLKKLENIEKHLKS